MNAELGRGPPIPGGRGLGFPRRQAGHRGTPWLSRWAQAGGGVGEEGEATHRLACVLGCTPAPTEGRPDTFMETHVNEVLRPNLPPGWRGWGASCQSPSPDGFGPRHLQGRPGYTEASRGEGAGAGPARPPPRGRNRWWGPRSAQRPWSGMRVMEAKQFCNNSQKLYVTPRDFLILFIY